jgi:hypothetical protein
LQDHLGVPTTLLNTTIFPESAGTLPLSNLIKNVTASALAKAPAPAPIKSDVPIARYREKQALRMAENG